MYRPSLLDGYRSPFYQSYKRKTHWGKILFCGSIFFFFFLSGWRRPSGVHTQPDCTLSLFFLFSFLSLFRNLLPGGKRRRAFWFVPLMCRIYSGKEEEEGGGPPCPIQVESCRRWQQPKKGGTPDEVRIFFSLLFCVLSIYPPTNLTDPPTDHQRPFLCVCVPVPVGKLEAISP